MARLRNAIEASDKWTINREVHAFKGSVATFFARGAAHTASQLENAKDFSTASRAADLFEQDMAALLLELRKVLNQNLLDEESSHSSTLIEVPPRQTEGAGKTTETPLNQTLDPVAPGDKTETLVSNSGMLRSTADADQPDVIGRYLILEPIGKGGFGTVFKGFDERLDREIAVKVPRLRQDVSRNSADVEIEFLHEARRVA